MPRPLFTSEELEELRRFDEEVEEDFVMTPEEREVGNQLERQSKIDRSYGPEKTTRTYLEKNRDRIRARNKAYYEAHKEHLRAIARENARKNRKRNADRQRRYIAENKKRIEKRRRDYYERNRKKHSEAGGRMRKYRKVRKMTQKEIAQKLGVSQSLIARWEKGEFPINMERIREQLPELAAVLEEETSVDTEKDMR